MPRPPREFFQRDAVTLARDLLGQRLVRIVEGVRLSGIIVETEAYLGVEDLAAHTARGRKTARNLAMWGNGGHAYVYFTYGLHHCMNIVAGHEGEPIAVLLRALEPVEGLETMHTHRFGECEPQDRRADRHLCSGPGKLCKALAIDRSHNALDLVTSQELFVELCRNRDWTSGEIGIGPRVGVDYAKEWAAKPLRFFLRDNPHVSRP